jgi:RNA polymerase sigma-70 factor, ECF subfamily
VALILEATVASINSALQRARATVEERVPEQSQLPGLRAVRDQRLGELVGTYVDAMERGDVEAVVGMLAEEAAR